MNEAQQAYLVALVALTYPAWSRQRYALVWLWANLAAMLAASLAMDIGAMNIEDARLCMMIADLATGVALACRQGLPRVIAAGYAITVPLYVPLFHGLFTRANADFTVIYIVAALQIGALAIGSLGGSSGGHRRRLSSGGLSVATQKGDHRLLPGSVSCDAGDER